MATASIKPASQDSPLLDAGKKALEHVSKQAGWLPLFACIWVAVHKYNVRLPPRFNAGDTSYELLRIADEWTIPFATLMLFLLGDVLDKAVFKKRMADGTTKNRWPDTYFNLRRQALREDLNFGDGSYGAAMGVVNASLTWPFRIVSSNEFAKFLRSVVIPALVFGGYQLWIRGARVSLALEFGGFITAFAFLWQSDTPDNKRLRRTLLASAWAAFGTCAILMLVPRPQWPALLLLISAAMSLFGYLWLKHLHICWVYEAANYIKEQNQSGAKPRYVVSRLVADGAREVRLVFWDGKLVGSSMSPHC
jgi:hypothetical protein